MIPSAGTPLKLIDIIKASVCSCDFEANIRKMLSVKYAFTVNSGTTALYVILSVLKRLSNKNEIILPAYTAPSLILPIKKAGLKYKLADVSLETFNMDVNEALNMADDNTLAILCIHMFGIPLDMSGMRDMEGVCVIEDAASSFGTRKENKFTSTFGDIGFISFNRGKNLSIISGGLIVTDSDRFADIISDEIKKLPSLDFYAKVGIYLKAVGLSYAVRPWFYTIMNGAVSNFKYTSLHEEFHSFHYTDFQRSLGCALIKKSGRIFSDRERKGRLLYGALKDINGIRLPLIPDGWNVVFNQFPFLVEDEGKRLKLVNAVINSGLEATILYDKPIHKIYNSENQNYPNAEYMASRLVLIPVHHYVTERKLYKVVESIKDALK
ncbi:MAG: DegT/DnrJ/EryC1/StrS family aminotransferase [Deltaproteobacteria bacterium]|nr:DegT/DnrJ/EryC1/StrS family aminotransferase [Deltaproteobacteria bacterium]